MRLKWRDFVTVSRNFTEHIGAFNLATQIDKEALKNDPVPYDCSAQRWVAIKNVNNCLIFPL